MMANKQAQYPRLESAIGGIADFLARSVRRYKATQELRNISPSEASAIARDLGITKTELGSLTKHGVGFPERLKKMLSVLKIDGVVLQATNPALWRDMQKVCAFCEKGRRCDRELRMATAAKHFSHYCPNSANFDATRLTSTSRLAARAE